MIFVRLAKLYLENKNRFKAGETFSYGLQKKDIEINFCLRSGETLVLEVRMALTRLILCRAIFNLL